MTDKEINKLLKKAYKERLFGNGAEAIAILSRLHNEYPNNINYLGLLASTYYEENEYDLAIECCDKADLLDKDNPKTLDLRGLIAIDKGDKKSGEAYYREALEKDPLLIDCRLKLINLLFDEKRYEETASECLFVLKNNDTDKNNYTVKDKTQLFVTYLSILYHRYWESLIHLEKYEDAIPVIKEYVDLRSTTIKDPYFFHNEDKLLLKLYLLTDNEKGSQEYTNIWENHYKVSDKYLNGVMKDVKDGYLLTMNPDNYEIDAKGNFL